MFSHVHCCYVHKHCCKLKFTNVHCVLLYSLMFTDVHSLMYTRVISFSLRYTHVLWCSLILLFTHVYSHTQICTHNFLLFPFCLYATIAMHPLCTLCTRFAFGKYRILNCHDSTQDPFSPPVLSAFRRPCFRLRLLTCFT